MRPCVTILATLSALLLAACAQFEPLAEPPPEPPTPEDPFAPGATELPASETIEMRGKLGFVPAGRATFTFAREGEVYRTGARLETTGVVSLLYGVSVEAESVADARTARSRRYTSSSGDGEKAKRVEVAFGQEPGRIRSVITTAGGEKEIVREDPLARDPFAMVYALRRMDLAAGLTVDGSVFPEWNLYRAEVAVVGEEFVEVPAGGFMTLFVRIDLHKVVDGVPAAESRGMAVWLTRDNRRIPVRIAVDTERGRVTLGMTSYRRGPARADR